MALTFRTTGVWGSGKGSNLSATEGDDNIWTLHSRILELEENPPTPIGIHHFEVEGTLLTIVTTDGTEHGPFVLPIAQWRWTGAWLPVVQYFVGDIVENDGNIYFTRVQHISGTEFDPGLFTDEGQVYILILAKAAQPYDIGMFWNDNVHSGDDLLMTHVASRSFFIEPNFPGSQAWLAIGVSESTITLPIYIKRTGESAAAFGTLTFAFGENFDGPGQFGTFASIDPENSVEVEPGDRISIGSPYEEDSTAKELSVTIVCTTPSL